MYRPLGEVGAPPSLSPVRLGVRRTILSFAGAPQHSNLPPPFPSGSVHLERLAVLQTAFAGSLLSAFGHVVGVQRVSSLVFVVVAPL